MPKNRKHLQTPTKSTYRIQARYRRPDSPYLQRMAPGCLVPDHVVSTPPGNMDLIDDSSKECGRLMVRKDQRQKPVKNREQNISQKHLPRGRRSIFSMPDQNSYRYELKIGEEPGQKADTLKGRQRNHDAVKEFPGQKRTTVYKSETYWHHSGWLSRGKRLTASTLASQTFCREDSAGYRRSRVSPRISHSE